MKRNRKKYNKVELASALLMIAALLWLTISAPFINAAQQELAKLNKISNTNNPLAGSGEETANPFGSNTEEKAPGGSFSEEYIHDHHISDQFFSVASRSYKCEDAGVYTAFHGEVHVPPPNIA
ncbi:MAG: hypothetical protein ACHQFX_02470 [Chitinophagales bacterium]